MHQVWRPVEWIEWKDKGPGIWMPQREVFTWTKLNKEGNKLRMMYFFLHIQATY